MRCKEIVIVDRQENEYISLVTTFLTSVREDVAEESIVQAQMRWKSRLMSLSLIVLSIPSIPCVAKIVRFWVCLMEG